VEIRPLKPEVDNLHDMNYEVLTSNNMNYHRSTCVHWGDKIEAILARDKKASFFALNLDIALYVSWV
jgi:hypothetical protein